jgi:hypothetical protein
MLPNIENTDALILNYERNERTKTFRISIYEEKVNDTSAILGKLILGKGRLGNAGNNGGVLKRYITLTAR